MFFIINKEKLYAYIISVFTVIVLFVMAGIMVPDNNAIETNANIKNSNTINTDIINE